MKRILAIGMALAMLVGTMTVSAGAAYSKSGNNFNEDNANNTTTAGEVAITGTNGEEIGSADITVNLQTGAPGEITHVYAVSYDVKELTFVYGSSAGKIWNPETLKYETVGNEDGWSTKNQIINITNYSDLPVKVEATINPFSDTGVSIDPPEALELESAAPADMTKPGEEQSGSLTFTMTGTPLGVYETATEIGTITLTVTNNV